MPKHKDYEDKDGIRYYSVTTMLGIIRKPELERWRGDKGNQIADQILEVAQDFGTAFHEYARIINAGKGHEIDLDEVSEGLQAKVKWYRDWYFENVEEVIMAEENIYSKKFQFKGTPDLVAKLKSIRTVAIVDYKTGNNIYRDVNYQLSAYKEGVKEYKGIAIRDRIILHLPRDKHKNKMIVLDPNTHESDFNGFLMAGQLFRNWSKK